ncbi:MAG: TonB-dependent receptor [Ferruginibacter sp.]|nr:TonB-dependent receptor [Rhodoferax sp.]
MLHFLHCRCLCAAALLTSTQAMAQGEAPQLAPVDVYASASEQRRFDSAASQSSVAVDGFRTAGPLVNLSELLVGQPGVVVQNRQNYAQDLQIAVRGFGTRATFGVRGVRILVDGIPATMPDGQGQAATAALASAARIDVLRGPLAQLYGNAAGGVVQITSREPVVGGAASASLAVGQDGQRLTGLGLDFGDKRLGGQLDLTHFETDGYRQHSAAQRTHLNAKLVAQPNADTRITTLVNLFHQPSAQDPLGLTWAQYQADPRQAASVASTFDTRKSITQNQLGLVLDQRLGAQDSLRARLYGGGRQVTQTLAFSGAATNSAGGVVDLDRQYGGAGLSWTHTLRTASGLPVAWTLGTEYDRLREQRRGFVNQNGSFGDLRRDEQDTARNADLYAQLDATLSDTWRAVAGLRHSRVRLGVDDRYTTTVNPDDSGSRSYRHTSPVLGLVWSPRDDLNIYAHWGQGFETPTLSEMAYSQTNTGPNFGLNAATSQQAELGAKWREGTQQLEAALFHSRSRDEIVPAATVGGRTVYQNADRVVRRGAELAWRSQWGGWGPSVAYTYLDAYFAQPYSVAAGGTVAAGTRLPGSARNTAALAVDYSPSPDWKLGAQWSLASRVAADDLNTGSAPGYGVLGLRVGYAFKANGAAWYAWARVDNLLDTAYVGSLIVNDGNRRFYEAAPGRRMMVGLRAQI